MKAATTTHDAWRDLQRASSTQTLVRLRILHTLADCGVKHVQIAQMTQDWEQLKRRLRDVAPALAAQQLLEALQKEEEWRAREAAGTLDPEWDYEQMVGQYRRAAIVAATMPQGDPALQGLAAGAA